MNRLIAFVLLALLTAPASRAQNAGSFQSFIDTIQTMSDAEADSLWNALRDEQMIPFAEGDSVAFLWRGSASSVAVAGDHSGWRPQSMERVGSLNIWMRVYRFPEAARIDYKLIVDGNWILDPNNSHRQMSGFGYNSELRMPEWTFPEETVRHADRPAGTVTDATVFSSDTLGYDVRYRVYTPPGYDTLDDLPVIYVTDGHEYVDPERGAVPVVMDNLTAEGRIEPALVVFVDPRRPGSGQNLREQQYVQNPDFAYFVAKELVPSIDAQYRTQPDRDHRIILGTSLGGLFATYLGLLHPEQFGRLAIQSPAYWVSENASYWSGRSIYAMVEDAPDSLFQIHLSTGTIGDAEDESRRMVGLMEERGFDVRFQTVPEGHSWGNWRALIDEMATFHLAPPGSATGTKRVPTTGDLDLRAFPNPTHGPFQLGFTLANAATTRLACFDLLGRRAARPQTRMLPAGEHALSIQLGASGTYVCRIHAAGVSGAESVTVIR